jgi:hypothetical protein
MMTGGADDQLLEVKSTLLEVSYFTATLLRCEAVSGLQSTVVDLLAPIGAQEPESGPGDYLPRAGNCNYRITLKKSTWET